MNEDEVQKNNAAINAYLEENDVEFIDFGASKGGSIDSAKNYFGNRKTQAIGIDLDPGKVAHMNDNGYCAFIADIAQLKLRKKVRFVIMAHFLEHLSGFPVAARIISVAANSSSEFVFIRQPYFDADDRFLSLGLKPFWSDWTGHSYHMQSIELYKIFRNLYVKGKVKRFCIYGNRPIKSTNDPSILPLTSLRNQHEFDPTIHPEKAESSKKLSFPAYTEVMVLASTSSEADFKKLERQFPWSKKIIDSDNFDIPLVEN